MSDNPQKKTVWLLGSGFSKPLGGPLLRDLFRPEVKEDILPFFPADTYPDLAESLPWVQCCFQNGVKEGIWDNAEQFLSYVDDAYAGSVSPKRKRIGNLIKRSNTVTENALLGWASHVEPGGGPGPYQIYQAYKANISNSFDRKAKRALASECSRFLMSSEPKTSESWLPYREWVTRLSPDADTIISFNYDRTIEMATIAAGVQSGFHVVMPSQAPLANRVPILKLHGSVDWRLQASPSDKSALVIEKTSVPVEEILRSPQDNIAIAAPGGSKTQFVGAHLDAIWSAAENALAQTTRLMIVGYSFPDTDPGAQYRLLNAFDRGRQSVRSAHIVLGTNTGPESRRVLSLIRSTAKHLPVRVSDYAEPGAGFNIVQHPLGTQDVIGRYRAFTA